MLDFQIKVSKSSEECMKSIKGSFRNYYDSSYVNNSGKWIWNVYSYKAKNDTLSIMSRGIGYPTVVLIVCLAKNKENETTLKGTFAKSIIQRAIIWSISLMMFSLSILYLLGVLIGDVPMKVTPLVTIGIPLMVLMISISYLIYSEQTRKKEKKKIVDLLTSIFSKLGTS